MLNLGDFERCAEDYYNASGNPLGSSELARMHRDSVTAAFKQGMLKAQEILLKRAEALLATQKEPA